MSVTELVHYHDRQAPPWDPLQVMALELDLRFDEARPEVARMGIEEMLRARAAGELSHPEIDAARSKIEAARNEIKDHAAAFELQIRLERAWMHKWSSLRNWALGVFFLIGIGTVLKAAFGNAAAGVAFLAVIVGAVVYSSAKDEEDREKRHLEFEAAATTDLRNRLRQSRTDAVTGRA